MSITSRFADEIDLCLRSRFTIIWLVSNDEERIIEMLKQLCHKTDRNLIAWDTSSYFTPLVGETLSVREAKDAGSALDAIANTESNRDTLFVLKDFDKSLKHRDGLARKMRDMASSLRATRNTIIVTSVTREYFPDLLKDDASVMDFPPPDFEELNTLVASFSLNPDIRVALTEKGRKQLVRSALGLSLKQAQRILNKCILAEIKSAHGSIKPSGTLADECMEMVSKERRMLLSESSGLQYISNEPTLEQVGGLDCLKDWLRSRGKGLTQEARDYGLPAPRGIALIGVPGTGKSLTAKTVARLWHLPLVRLDVGALYGPLLGESEEHLRRALALAEAAAPCVLWIDEMEKAFSPSFGTSLRLMGTFVTWMQEKSDLVFVIGTINDVAALPAEFLRRGRFDEVFFLDLPTTEERKEILRVHLAKRDRLAAEFALDTLARASEGYVGAEIEQAVIDGMYLAFNDADNPGREITTNDILRALQSLVPLSRSNRERVEKLRQWLRDGRARPASRPETA